MIYQIEAKQEYAPVWGCEWNLKPFLWAIRKLSILLLCEPKLLLTQTAYSNCVTKSVSNHLYSVLLNYQMNVLILSGYAICKNTLNSHCSAEFRVYSKQFSDNSCGSIYKPRDDLAWVQVSVWCHVNPGLQAPWSWLWGPQGVIISSKCSLLLLVFRHLYTEV